MPEQFCVKQGATIQHANTSYGEGAIVPFDSDDVDLVLFHAPNINAIDAIADEIVEQVNELLDNALSEIPIDNPNGSL